MTTRRMQWLVAVAAIGCFCGLGVHAAPHGADIKPVKDLYYFVIDRSSSIAGLPGGKNSLVNPIRGAVIDFVGKLAPDTTVEMVFFGTSASSPKRWDKMDLASKGDLTTYFYEQFKPKDWTRLYDTVAEVIEKAQKEAPNYRAVNIIILSDGVDQGPNGTMGSEKHLSWASVEALAKDLKMSNRDSLIYWYTLGFNPPEDSKLQPGSPIEQISVPEPQKGIVIKAPVPKAAFACSPTKVQVNEPVLFVLDSETGVEKAQWSFGDGASATNLKPHHAFAAEGSYSVKVTVAGAGGENTVTNPKAVQVLRNVPLEASFKWSPETVRIRQKVQFVEESLGSPDSWSWEFTGLPPMNERSPTVTFASAGPVTATLTIGKEGQKHSVSKRFDVLPPVPIKAAFKWSPATVRVGEKVQFVDDSVGSPASWSWEFTGLAPMNERSPIVEFATAGPVTAKLTIEKDGQKNSTTMNLEVVPLAPLKAAFKWSPEKIRIGESVQFVDESLGSPETWSWEFPGQQPLTDKSPATVFSKPGPVTVSLTVGKDKRTDTAKQTVEVLPPPPPSLKASFSVSPEKGIYPLEVQFKDASQGAIASYRWDFGDGQTSDVKDPKHTYQEAGSWTPRLTIRNAEKQEARDTGAIVIAVSNPPPPPPWWKKPLLYAALALAAWVLLIVPFIVNPVLAPQPKVAFKGPNIYFLRALAGRGIANVLWPRSAVTLGTGKLGDINKLGGPGEKPALLARVSRIPLSSNYTLTVLRTGSVVKISLRNDGLTGKKEVQEPLPSGRAVALRQDDAFIFMGNTRLAWEQPASKKVQKKK
jgi:PKD repeat protein